ncbi:MAG: hypothetical protein KR126chlam4_01464 [Candidatus Anoxychlamydiales bacterium]|nr:hypothetical protein [Candidatus Anoxychlamydiales bacterium]
MIDLSTTIALAICSKNPLVIKVLGPTADYIGEGIKSLAEKQVKNVKRIFRRTSEKLDNHGTPTGAVPPRILKQTLEEGGYVDDELTAEYYSGVLASSKSLELG